MLKDKNFCVTPEISILIPTYNRPHYLQECIESCLSQDCLYNVEGEIIIVDNSDNHETALLMESYKTISPSIRYYHNDQNIGMIPNWNKALDMVAGKYFIFLSDDDKFCDHASLRLLYEKLQDDVSLGAIAGQRIYINAEGKKIDTEKVLLNVEKEIHLTSKDFLSNNNALGFGGTLFRSDAQIRFDETTGLFADWDYHLQFTQKYVIKVIPHYTFMYRIHEVKSFKEQSLFTVLKRQYNVYKKLGYPTVKLLVILLFKLVSAIVWKLITKTNSHKIISFYVQISNRIFGIKKTRSS